MSLISRLFEKWFGGKKSTHVTNQHQNKTIPSWEMERQERISESEKMLKDWIVTELKQKGSLNFSWESGGDEAFVTIEGADPNQDNFIDLEEYIINKLDIPDAGEFQMNGAGTIYIAGNLVRAKYRSSMKAMIDFDEETEQEIYSDEEKDSDDRVLFSI